MCQALNERGADPVARVGELLLQSSKISLASTGASETTTRALAALEAALAEHGLSRQYTSWPLLVCGRRCGMAVQACNVAWRGQQGKSALREAISAAETIARAAVETEDRLAFGMNAPGSDERVLM